MASKSKLSGRDEGRRASYGGSSSSHAMTPTADKTSKDDAVGHNRHSIGSRASKSSSDEPQTPAPPASTPTAPSPTKALSAHPPQTPQSSASSSIAPALSAPIRRGATQSFSTLNAEYFLAQQSAYAFDRVFAPDATTSAIFDEVVRDIVASTMQGMHGSVFMYGQTASGKTFTMNGAPPGQSPGQSPGQTGVIPLAVHACFDSVALYPDREFLVRVSYVEVYNEQLRDLLAPDAAAAPPVRILHDPRLGAVLTGVKEHVVLDFAQVAALLRHGESQRHVGATEMNEKSSRAHTLFRVVVESKERAARHGPVRVSTLNLVDLAGSESAKMTNSRGQRLQEARHINQSLLALSTVIQRLSEDHSHHGHGAAGAPRRTQHLPFRDSKLTRLLETALDGNGRIAVICTVSPTLRCVEETANTLKFGARAKLIQMHAKVNEALDDKTLLRAYREEIEQLKRRLRSRSSAAAAATVAPATGDADIDVDAAVAVGDEAAAAEEDEAAVAAEQLAMLQMIGEMERLILTADASAAASHRLVATASAAAASVATPPRRRRARRRAAAAAAAVRRAAKTAAPVDAAAAVAASTGAAESAAPSTPPLDPPPLPPTDADADADAARRRRLVGTVAARALPPPPTATPRLAAVYALAEAPSALHPQLLLLSPARQRLQRQLQQRAPRLDGDGDAAEGDAAVEGVEGASVLLDVGRLLALLRDYIARPKAPLGRAPRRSSGGRASDPLGAAVSHDVALAQQSGGAARAAAAVARVFGVGAEPRATGDAAARDDGRVGPPAHAASFALGGGGGGGVSLEELQAMRVDLKLKEADNQFLQDEVESKDRMLALLTDGLKEVAESQRQWLVANRALAQQLAAERQVNGSLWTEIDRLHAALLRRGLLDELQASPLWQAAQDLQASRSRDAADALRPEALRPDALASRSGDALDDWLHDDDDDVAPAAAAATVADATAADAPSVAPERFESY
eukprot:gene2781-2021_t